MRKQQLVSIIITVTEYHSITEEEGKAVGYELFWKKEGLESNYKKRKLVVIR